MYGCFTGVPDDKKNLKNDHTVGPLKCDLERLLVCAGLGGAVGYALGGLDWTHTFLRVAFKSQEQILFFFAAILFSISVALHLFSIEEEQYSPQHERLDQVRPEQGRRSSQRL